MPEITIIDLFLKFLENSIATLKSAIKWFFGYSLCLVIMGIILLIYILSNREFVNEFSFLITLATGFIGSIVYFPIKEVVTRKNSIRILENVHENIIEYHKDSTHEVKESLESDFLNAIKEAFKN